MRVLGVIPARSGSKGVKNKNIRLIKGKPLLEYSVFTALEAKKEGILSDVILSTDSREYLELLKDYEIYKDYLRPKKFSQDNSPTIDAIKDALLWLEKKYNKTFDAVMLLQPTSPFRTIDHIKEAILMLKNSPEASCVVSVKKLADHHPYRIKKIDNHGYLKDICSEFIEPEYSRRQDFDPIAYIRNGCIYLTPIKLIKSGIIRGDKVLAMQMPEANSINVDEHFDYLSACNAFEYEEFKDDLNFFNKLIN
tara:strand:+ start:1196 stop:1948 length:753 start_codon:yes stop_codon:yes gene_type:complete